MWKKIWRFETLKYIVVFILPALFVLLFTQSINNDSWFVLAEGRHIVNDGLFYTDALSMHQDLSITVQQYGFAACFWLIYSVAGPAGLYVMMLALNFIICLLIYKICMLLSDKNKNLSLVLMVLSDVVLALGFVTTRAQMVSYILFLALIYILELYVKTKKVKYLWVAPLISLIQINMHASMWWLLIIVMLVYIIDSIKAPKIHLQGYKTTPLIIAAIAMLLTGLINPYGTSMITYIFTSYGGGPIFGLVDEMKPFTLRSIFGVMLYIMIAGVLILCIYGPTKKDIRMRHLLMFFGFFALGINSVKGMSELILVAYMPIAAAYKKIKVEKILYSKTGRNALIMWSGVVAIPCAIACAAILLPNLDNYPDKASFEGLNAIDESVEKSNLSKNDLKIYAGYNDGGYVEFRGYKSYLDPRAEVFLKNNNGKEDILQEYVDYITRTITTDEMLAKYDFDYLFVRSKDDPAYQLDDKKYEILYSDENSETIIYKKVFINEK